MIVHSLKGGDNDRSPSQILCGDVSSSHIACQNRLVLHRGLVGDGVRCSSPRTYKSATVVGTLTDPTGAVIPNATVTLTNTATSVTAHATTNAEGAYYIPFQPAGTYTLTIDATGFKKYVQTGIILEIGQTPRFDVRMDVGTTSQQVEVTAANPLLATDNAVVGGTVDAKVIHDVPMVQAKPQHLMFYLQGRRPTTTEPITYWVCPRIKSTSPSTAASSSRPLARPLEK